MLKKAIFDMDGLIFDTERLFMEHLTKIMSEYGYKMTADIYAGMVGYTVSEVKKYMQNIYGADYPFKEISDKARESMEKSAQDGLPVKKGIINLLKDLNKRGIECCVASSTMTKHVRKYIEDADIAQYFTEAIGGEMAQHSKPAPDIFLKAIGDVKAEEAVVFEDSMYGVMAAVNAGIRVVCIPDLKRPPQELLDKAFACVKDADEAIKVTEEI